MQPTPPRPSYLTLPKLDPPPPTVLAHLEAVFPHLPAGTWAARMARGAVDVDGRPLEVASPYKAGMRVRYFRESVQEPDLPFEARILYRDEYLLVADKPPFMPVTPTGPWVRQCLLYRMGEATGLQDLAPLHRLDRETAGLVLFAVRPETRGAFHDLFMHGRMEKTYRALARVDSDPGIRDWTVENRLEPEPGSLRMRAAAGLPNASTQIRLQEVREGLGRFEVRPATGKKHQIRVHMLGLGFPILGDRIYPDLLPSDYADFSHPLQLLGATLAFVDPISGRSREFASEQVLTWPR